MKLNQYRIHCVTESLDVITDYRDATLAVPTTCPNNMAHSIDSTATIVLNIIDTQFQIDSDGATFSRSKEAPTGWTYQMRGMEFTTAQFGSLVNRDANNAQLSDANIKFYDASGTQVTDASLLNTIVKTVMDWEPPFDYYIIGGIAKILVAASSDCRMSVTAVPDVPYSYGGSKVMIQSVNFKFIGTTDKIDADGRASKMLSYSATNHTNKLRFCVFHTAGEVNSFAVFVEHYRV